MDAPVEVVLAYIAAYDRWNQAARQTGLTDADRAWRAAGALLGPYCWPGPATRPGSYGYPSMHQPGREVVRWAKVRGGRGRVGTRLTQHFGTAVFEMEYTYHLRPNGGQWLIERVVGPKHTRLLP